jgi:TatD DNase family protein
MSSTEKIDLIDTHVHLDAPVFSDDLDLVVERAKDHGVSRMITIGSGYGIESAQRAISISERYTDSIWCSVGVHPLDASTPRTDDILSSLEAHARHPRVVAIGEAGIDLHWNKDPLPVQERWFIDQIEIARRVKKPLIIHSREAGERCIELLREHRADEVGGVFHCFAEDASFAIRLRELNFLVSFTGVLTFKKAESIRAIAVSIPLSQIMVETDGPYMAPEPHRGKRCEPAFTRFTAECLAAVHRVSLAEVAAVTSKNAEMLFRIPAKAD